MGADARDDAAHQRDHEQQVDRREPRRGEDVEESEALGTGGGDACAPVDFGLYFGISPPQGEKVQGQNQGEQQRQAPHVKTPRRRNEYGGNK